MSLRLVPALALAALVLSLGARAAPPPGDTFAAAGTAAAATLMQVFYGGNGLWRECDSSDCPRANQDWGVDSLTYALWLRWQTAHDSSIPPVMQQLAATAPSYPPPCTASCGSWSDVPEWDAVAALREYAVLRDPAALAKAEAAFETVEGSNAYRLGACPTIRYQQPYGEDNRLKTLETDGNAIKAAILLYRATGDRSYLADATQTYAAARRWFFDRSAGLYSVWVFDDGTRCRQVPHRFYASVNGDMIWNGIALAAATGDAEYRREALATGRAVAAKLADPAGVFADLQAENDVVEPLVEGMYSLATGLHASFARSWILTNAAAAVEARAPDGAFGRFFDGPPPATRTTAWQSDGGLALEIAAAKLDPAGQTATSSVWTAATRFSTDAGPGTSITIDGSAVALLGTLGETCCEPGHARVFVDGRETFDRTGIWQDKSSLGQSIPDSILFAWRWPRPGRHTIRFEPGIPNGKEGGSFLHITSYLVG
jgi:uncharacterized Zn-binding protein involved in type VI secretion